MGEEEQDMEEKEMEEEKEKQRLTQPAAGADPDEDNVAHTAGVVDEFDHLVQHDGGRRHPHSVLQEAGHSVARICTLSNVS